MKKKTKSKYFTPNNIDKFDRNFYSVLAGGLFLYSVYALIADKVYIPGRHYKQGILFHGPPVYFVVFGFVFLIALLMSYVVDHFDRRNNERRYVKFRKIMRFLWWFCFIGALVMDVVFYRLSERM